MKKAVREQLERTFIEGAREENVAHWWEFVPEPAPNPTRDGEHIFHVIDPTYKHEVYVPRTQEGMGLHLRLRSRTRTVGFTKRVGP